MSVNRKRVGESVLSSWEQRSVVNSGQIVIFLPHSFLPEYNSGYT